jgi:hypothetical protein
LFELAAIRKEALEAKIEEKRMMEEEPEEDPEERAAKKAENAERLADIMQRL